MSEETKVSERTAVRDAFEQNVRLMYAVLLDNLVQNEDDIEAVAASNAFKKGLGLSRKAMELALNIINE